MTIYGEEGLAPAKDSTNCLRSVGVDNVSGRDRAHASPGGDAIMAVEPLARTMNLPKQEGSRWSSHVSADAASGALRLWR